MALTEDDKQITVYYGVCSWVSEEKGDMYMCHVSVLRIVLLDECCARKCIVKMGPG